ncbi:SH3 domain-containing protein [Paenibacillus alkaliterrae]|uniref:C40 family peptidase n=1 Tax=Paenibacillus alkaliterrae TaxID=320909 RepID=UPI001F48796A|nr:SH3 domain-containing protein [Paenibacillus alkaliterrae]
MKQRMATATLTAALLFSSISVPAALAAQSAEVQTGVNFRTSPSASASVIRTLKKGEQVSVVDKVNSYWYKVSDSSGRTGYISASSKYISIESPPSSAVQSGNAIVKASVSFRKAASASGQRIRFLKKGEQVTVLSKTNKYWYEVQDANGVRGYVSTQSSYLDVTGTISGGTNNSGGSGNSGGGAVTSPGASSSEAVERVIAAGMKYLGTPYEYGSSRNTTTTFDCSDFVRQAFIDGVGLKLPADSRQQGQYVKDKGDVKTDWRQLERGDLIFFMSYKGTKASSYSGVNKSTATITHDGIYLGDGKILHTYSKESGGVTISSIEGTHWEYRFLYGGSAL